MGFGIWTLVFDTMVFGSAVWVVACLVAKLTTATRFHG